MSGIRSNPVLRVKTRELLSWMYKFVKEEYPEFSDEQVDNEIATQIINLVEDRGGPHRSCFQNQEYYF